jgi:Mycobacterium membrane protein
MNVLKRGWIPLLIVVVVAIAGFTVYRMHGAFDSDNEITRADARTQRHLHQACRYRRPEKLLHCNLYREDIRVFRGFGQASASRPGPP